MKNLEKIEKFLVAKNCKNIEFGWGDSSTTISDYLEEAKEDVENSDEAMHLVRFFVPVLNDRGDEIARKGFLQEIDFFDEKEVERFSINYAKFQLINDASILKNEEYFRQWKASGSSEKLKDWKLKNPLKTN